MRSSSGSNRTKSSAQEPDQFTLSWASVHDRTRRCLLRGTALAVGGAVLDAPLLAQAAPLDSSPQGARFAAPAVRLHHLHTGESLAFAHMAAPREPRGFHALLNRFLRDHYSGDQGTMDPGLIAQIRRLRQLLASDGTVEVISGYRSLATNQRLRKGGGGGVASRSLHLEGRALDFRIVGIPLGMLRDVALDLRAGGVGFYPESNFLHIDTGPVRRWG